MTAGRHERGEGPTANLPGPGVVGLAPEAGLRGIGIPDDDPTTFGYSRLLPGRHPPWPHHPIGLRGIFNPWEGPTANLSDPPFEGPGAARDGGFQ